MDDKIDYKKRDKLLYNPPKTAQLIEVPELSFIMVDGVGEPKSDAYQHAVSLLYALSYTIKMSKKSATKIVGFFDYVVPPLESLWSSGEQAIKLTDKSHWCWTAMIRQPEFVTKEVFDWALEQVKRKKPELDSSLARFGHFTEGLCVQIMHIGAYADETRSLNLIDEYIANNQLQSLLSGTHRHHEIYLSDPNKVTEDKLKTILRIPVKPL